MRNKQAIRCAVVPLALLSLLVLATLGCVWHHHVNSADTNCSICHLNHQALERPVDSDRTSALERPVDSDRAPALGLVEATAGPREPEFASGPAILRIPARAPPIA